MKVLEKNSTWDIIDKPKDKRVVGYRWIYIVKCKFDETLDRYKTRLIAKGYTWTYGINYEETFALVAKMNMKKKSTWRFPQDSILIMKRTRCADLKRFCMDLNSLPKHDDMIVTGDNEIEKLTLKEKLATQFEMKEILECKTLGVPIEQNHRIECEESSIIVKSQYQRLVGKLIYLTHTRIDIQKRRYIVHEIYTDASYAGLVVDRRSTSEYCMSLVGNLVTWMSKKKNVVARSSAKGEF
ncbi:Copia protein, partial [Mucuna pruriens]